MDQQQQQHHQQQLEQQQHQQQMEAQQQQQQQLPPALTVKSEGGKEQTPEQAYQDVYHRLWKGLQVCLSSLLPHLWPPLSVSFETQRFGREV